MRPLVAPVPELLDQRPLGATEGPSEDVVPRFPHQLEERGGVPVLDRLLAERSIVSREAARGVGRLRLALALELTGDEGREPLAEELHRLPDSFLVGEGHLYLPLLRSVLIRRASVPLRAYPDRFTVLRCHKASFHQGHISIKLVSREGHTSRSLTRKV